MTITTADAAQLLDAALSGAIVKPSALIQCAFVGMDSNLFKELNRLFRDWESLLLEADWYLSVVPEIEKLQVQIAQLPKSTRDECKALLYGAFDRWLKEGRIALAHESPDTDFERKTVDTIVIHHTSNPAGLTPERLSAIELIRLYGPRFANPPPGENSLRGAAIYSGHTREGRQVFWPYHWIVRRNGTADQLLNDDEIGWHAGDWDVNCRSIAIVLDGDYENAVPSEPELRGIAGLIRKRYSQVPLRRVFGHREVNPRTSCPSKLFLKNGQHFGWKKRLIELTREMSGGIPHRC